MSAKPITRVPPPAVFALALVISLVLQLFVVKLHLPWSATTRWMAGAPWSIVGATSVLASAQQFANAEQDARPWVAQDKPPILFKGGPYRFSRNPMYLGEFLAQIGLGVMANNLWIPLLAFAALMVVRQTVVLPEEAYLRRELGTSYEEYLRSVRRWI